MRNILKLLNSLVYSLISFALGIISIIMIATAIWGIWISIDEHELLVPALLTGIGLIVIGMAVFDVCKFLLEEEVFKEETGFSTDELPHQKERQTLLKFLVIMTIAIFLEALVFIFDAAKKDITLLIYPTYLLIAAILLVVSIGVYQKLSREE